MQWARKVLLFFLLFSAHLYPSPNMQLLFCSLSGSKVGEVEVLGGSCSRLGKYSKGRPWLGLANVKADWFSHGPLPRAVPLPRLTHLVLSPGIQPAPVEQLHWTFPHSPFAYLAHRTCTCPCGLQDRGSVPLSGPLLAGHPAGRRSASAAPSQGLNFDT